jgi:hypothetical protein
MVVAIVLYAGMRIVRLIFVGLVLVHGIYKHILATVIDMIKWKPRQPGMHKKHHGQRFNDICSTTIGT